MDMRDEIAQIIWEHETGGVDHKGAADAIIADLPDMIAPLVWDCRSPESCIAQNPFGQYLVENCHEDGFGMWTPRDCIEDEPPFGYHNSAVDAKAAADAHHRAAIMAAFNQSREPTT